jgi:hypothetical protein
MTLREAVFALALTVCGGISTYGIALLSVPVAFIIAGALLGLLCWSVLADE